MNARVRRLPQLAAAVALMIAVAAPAALAVTLVNRDDKDHKLTIVEDGGAKTTEHVLKPSQVLEGICEKGCVVRINDSEEDEYELEGGDKVSIEEGYLYYDEQEGAQQGAAAPAPAAPAPAAPAPAAPAQTPQPGSGEPKKQ